MKNLKKMFTTDPKALPSPKAHIEFLNFLREGKRMKQISSDSVTDQLYEMTRIFQHYEGSILRRNLNYYVGQMLKSGYVPREVGLIMLNKYRELVRLSYND